MTVYGEQKTKEICARVHGNDSLWRLYLEDAREELRKKTVEGAPPAASLADLAKLRSGERAGHVRDPVLAFGQKHRGKRLENVPTEYLRWVYEKTDAGGDEELMTMIEDELESR